MRVFYRAVPLLVVAAHAVAQTADDGSFRGVVFSALLEETRRTDVLGDSETLIRKIRDRSGLNEENVRMGLTDLLDSLDEVRQGQTEAWHALLASGEPGIESKQIERMVEELAKGLRRAVEQRSMCDLERLVQQAAKKAKLEAFQVTDFVANRLADSLARTVELPERSSIVVVGSNRALRSGDFYPTAEELEPWVEANILHQLISRLASLKVVNQVTWCHPQLTQEKVAGPAPFALEIMKDTGPDTSTTDLRLSLRVEGLVGRSLSSTKEEEGKPIPVLLARQPGISSDRVVIFPDQFSVLSSADILCDIEHAPTGILLRRWRESFPVPPYYSVADVISGRVAALLEEVKAQ